MYDDEEPELAAVEPPTAPSREYAPRQSRPRASYSPLRNRGKTAEPQGMDMIVQALRAVQNTHVPRGRAGDAIKVGEFPTSTGLANWKWNFVRELSAAAGLMDD